MCKMFFKYNQEIDNGQPERKKKWVPSHKLKRSVEAAKTKTPDLLHLDAPVCGDVDNLLHQEPQAVHIQTPSRVLLSPHSSSGATLVLQNCGVWLGVGGWGEGGKWFPHLHTTSMGLLQMRLITKAQTK